MSISDAPNNEVCVVAWRDTWSRSARRKARACDTHPSASIEGREERDGNQRPSVLLVANVGIEERTGESNAQLVVRWKQGNDEQAFESFASHVGRKVREAAEADADGKASRPL